jgi:Spy/CpxP family protein refolding chaperone
LKETYALPVALLAYAALTSAKSDRMSPYAVLPGTNSGLSTFQQGEKMKTRITVLAASLLFSTAALAQTAPAAPAAAPAAATHKANDRVEKHIKSLHDQLKITAAQEAQWGQVAQIMRDNADKIDELIAQREDASTMTALDDLDSYAQLTQANSDGVKKLSAVFAPLYNSMSDAQKQNADKVFSQGQNRRVVHNKKPVPQKG